MASQPLTPVIKSVLLNDNVSKRGIVSSNSFDENRNRKGFRIRSRKRSSVATGSVGNSEANVNGFISQPDLSKMSATQRLSKVEILKVPNPEPDRNATDLWTVEPDGRVRLRMEPQGVASMKPLTVHTVFANTVERSPYHPALAYKKDPKGKEYTYINYIEYYRMVVTAAKGFIKLGLEPKHSVGIIGFNSVEWFVADLGAIFAGGFACGIYTTNSPEACQYVAANASAQIIVVDDVAQTKKILAVRDQLPKLKAIIQWKGDVPDASDPMQMTWDTFMKLGSELEDSAVEERLSKQVPNECCTLIYTSGTTGNPKGVMLSHDNLTWTASYVLSYSKLTTREIIVSYLPLSHIAAQIVDVYGMLALGGTSYFAQPDALKGSLGQTLREVRPTVFFGVPRVWEKIQEKIVAVGKSITGPKKKLATWAKGVGYRGCVAQMTGRPTPWGWAMANMLVLNTVKKTLGLDRCRLNVTAAAPITKETIDFFMSLNIPLLEVYGMSESTGPHTLSVPSKFFASSVGVTAPGAQTKLDKPDADGNGEVCMSSRNVFMGYLNEREKTQETMDEDGWLHSGDVGKIDDKGFTFITGRIKELLITAGGENVAPVPIEDKVKERLPCLSNCMLIGDKKKFLAMLLTLKCEVDEEGEPLDQLAAPALDWLRTACHCGPEVTTVADVRQLCEDQSGPVAKAIQAGIASANKDAVSRACAVQKWTILPKDFSLIGGELGPTLKLRRPIVSKMYASTIDAFYEE